MSKHAHLKHFCRRKELFQRLLTAATSIPVGTLEGPRSRPDYQFYRINDLLIDFVPFGKAGQRSDVAVSQNLKKFVEGMQDSRIVLEIHQLLWSSKWVKEILP